MLLHLMQKAVYSSENTPLIIGGVEIPCYVLEDGTRVISQRGAMSAIGMSLSGGSAGTQRLAKFAGSDRLKPFIDADTLTRIENPIKFTINNVEAFGYDAEIIPALCMAILAAKEAGSLQVQQFHLADQASILIKAFNELGWIALIDEATGYQKVRAADELQAKVNAFIAKETRQREKTFPDEFFTLLYKLEGTTRSPLAKTHPLRFGKYIMQFVYDTMDEDISNRLRENNINPGRENPLHHLRFTDVAHNKLLLHLMQIVGIMKTTKTMDDLKMKIEEAYPHAAAKTHLRQQEERQKDMPYRNMPLFEGYEFE